MNPKIIQQIDKAVAEEEVYQRWQSDIEFSRKPYWKQLQEEGDYLPEDSGICVGDDEIGYEQEED